MPNRQKISGEEKVEFHADTPNEKWLTDVTEIKWYEGPVVQNRERPKV